MTVSPSSPSNEDKPHLTRAKLIVPILIACLVILAGLYSPWVLFASFALLPSLLIRMIDKSEKRVLSFSITGLNVTGLMLALQHSCSTYGSAPQSGILFQDWVNWALPFGLAWIGILFFMAFPVVFAAVMEVILQNKERRLKEKQKNLLKVWGTQLGQKTTTLSEKEESSDKKKSVEKEI